MAGTRSNSTSVDYVRSVEKCWSSMTTIHSLNETNALAWFIKKAQNYQKQHWTLFVEGYFLFWNRCRGTVKKIIRHMVRALTSIKLSESLTSITKINDMKDEPLTSSILCLLNKNLKPVALKKNFIEQD